MRTARFKVYQDSKKQWRWSLVAANGRKLAQGEAHTRKWGALRAMDTVRRLTYNIESRMNRVAFGSKAPKYRGYRPKAVQVVEIR